MKNENLSQKAIIFDSSTLINFAMNGLFNEFRELKKMFNGKFIIPKEVREEVVEHPMEIKRFKLEALKIKELIADKILEAPSDFGINDEEVSKLALEIQETANNTFSARGHEIHLIDPGESACMALSKLLNSKNIKNVISVDERTIRLLGEKPENLLSLLQKKLHTSVTANKENFKFFSGFQFIRSTELIYFAYKNGLVKLKNGEVLDALLYAMKFNGCSISDEEISEMEKMK